MDIVDLSVILALASSLIVATTIGVAAGFRRNKTRWINQFSLTAIILLPLVLMLLFGATWYKWHSENVAMKAEISAGKIISQEPYDNGTKYQIQSPDRYEEIVILRNFEFPTQAVLTATFIGLAGGLWGLALCIVVRRLRPRAEPKGFDLASSEQSVKGQ